VVSLFFWAAWWSFAVVAQERLEPYKPQLVTISDASPVDEIGIGRGRSGSCSMNTRTYDMTEKIQQHQSLRLPNVC
jgi:hypothetical protein